MTHDTLAQDIAAAARELQEESGSQHTMERALQLTMSIVDGCEHAAISLVRPERIDSPATSDDLAARVDELQYEFDQGPCLDAIREHEIVHSPDIARDQRWPVWGARTAAETGIRSMLSFRLFTTHDTVGALNLYASRPDAFDADDHENGLALAAHVALAVVTSHEIETLREGMDNRTMIGQATGILMERFDLDGEGAFAVLKRVSQHSNRKLRDVAHELVLTRRTPIYGVGGR